MTDHQQHARDSLQRAEPIPIAQLQPDIPNPDAHVVQGEVTITWPFSIVTKSIAFKLVETDFRLRLNKGQVRVDFHGASAKAVAAARIGGGDGIRLSLEGVEWVRSQSPARPDTLEWQLKFTNRLRLQIRRVDTHEEEFIDIESSGTGGGPVDGPAIEPPIDPSTPEPGSPVEVIPLPLTTGPATLPTKRVASSAFEDEYASPAFLKRARVSYGSLFEGGFDLFADERKDRTKRKRPRFSMHANWRYASRTPSPEPEPQSELSDESEPGAVEDQNPATQAESSPRPPMIDEGCQTQIVDVTPAKPKQAAEALPAEAATPATPTPNFPSRTHALENERPASVPGSVPEKQQQDAWGFPVPPPTRINGVGAIPPGQQEPTQPLHPSFDASNGTTYYAAATVEAGRQDVNRGSTHEQLEANEEPSQLPETHGFYTKPMDFQAPTRSPDRAAEQPSEVEEFTHDTVNQPPPFAPSQLEQASWSALTSLSQGQVPEASGFGNPEVIDSSSPARAPSSGPQHDAGEFEDEQPEVTTPREEQGDGPHGMGYMQVEPVPADSEDVSMRSQAEADEDESENEYDDKHGGDLAGEDYDLRNYDDAQDDDVVESYNSSEVERDESDPDKQVVDFDEEDDERDEMDEAEDGRDGWREPRGLAGPGFLDEDGDVDADGEEFDEDYESQEYDYDGAEEGGEEEEEEDDADYDEDDRPASKPVPAPKDPIFIDLLSDSEDGDEDKEEPEKQPAAPEKRADEPGPIEEAPSERPEAEAAPVSQAAPESLKQEPAQEQIAPKICEQLREASLTQEDRMAIDEEPQQLGQAQGEVVVEDRNGDDNAIEDDGASKESTRPATAEESEHVDKNASETTVLLGVPETTQVEATEPLQVGIAADVQVDDGSKAGPEGEPQVVEEAGVGPAAAPQDMNAIEQLPMGGDGQNPFGSGHFAPVSAMIETPPSANVEVEAKEVAMEPLPEKGPEGQAEGEPIQPVVEEAPEEPTTEVATEPASEEQPTKEVEMEPAAVEDSEEPAVEEVPAEPAGKETPEEPAVEEASEEPTVREVSEEQPTEEAAVQPAVEEALEEPAVKFTEVQAVETTDEPAVEGVTEEPAVEEPPQVSIKEVAMEPVVEVEELHKEPSAGPKEQDATYVGSSVAPEQGTSVPADWRAEEQQPTTLSGGEVEAVITDAPAPPPAEDGGKISAAEQEDDTSLTNPPELEDQITAVSPPLTQAHGEDTTMAKQPETVEEDEDRMDLVEHTGHLATPGETQREDTVMHDGEDEGDEDEVEDIEMSEADYSFAVEQQIMTESQVYASQQLHEQAETLDQPREAAVEEGGTQASSAATDEQRVTRSKAAARPEREILITAQSLRSWAHHRRHADTDGDDPSIALARAPDGAPGEDELQQDQPSTPPVIRAIRRRDENGDPSVQLAKSYAPPTHKGGRRHVTPEMTADKTTSEWGGDDKSHKMTPEPAIAAEEEVPPSPSITESSNADHSGQASVLKQKLTEDLRGNLGDFLPLKGLRGSLGKTADFIGVATATPEQPYRPKNGPRDYILELLLTDPESAPSTVVVALIYRPFQASLPVVRAGDVVLLRQFKVVSVKGRGFGVRACDASAWAVFDERAERLPQIRGPPVELSELEASHAEDLRRWWGLLDEKAMGRIEKATQKAMQAGQRE